MKRSSLNNEGEERDMSSLKKPQPASIIRATDQVTVRKTFSLPESLAEELDLHAEKKKKSVSKTICRAIETQLYLEEQKKKGYEISIRRPDGIYDFTDEL